MVGTRGLIGSGKMASALPVVVRVKRKRELAPVDTIVVEAEESHAAKRRAREAAPFPFLVHCRGSRYQLPLLRYCAVTAVARGCGGPSG